MDAFKVVPEESDVIKLLQLVKGMSYEFEPMHYSFILVYTALCRCCCCEYIMGILKKTLICWIIVTPQLATGKINCFPLGKKETYHGHSKIQHHWPKPKKRWKMFFLLFPFFVALTGSGANLCMINWLIHT